MTTPRLPRQFSICLLLALVVAGLAAAPAFATFPGLNGRIAYTDTSRSTGTGYDVWTMLPDGTGRQQLTNNPANDQGPGWSPDGTKIVFSSSRTGGGDIYVMNADGSNQTQLTTSADQESRPSWSPDGTKIAYTRNYEIWVMNADGSGQTQLTSGTDDSYGEDWSPDGTHIVYTQEGTNRGIYVMNADGSNQHLILGGVNDYYAASYSPDGTRIVCSCGASEDIATMNTDGSDYRQLTSTGDALGATWSPDGTKIAYTVGNANVWEMNADGSGQTQITTDLTGLGGLRWQTVPPPPTATTGAASGVTTSGATLNGSVNPRHSATTFHFEYGTSTAYGSRTADQAAGSDATNHAESAAIAGLAPNTTYHFRIVATSAAGTSYGADQVFTTSANRPIVKTGSASVSGTGATVRGSVNPNGVATTYHFDYGTSKRYGRSTSSRSAGSGTSARAVSRHLSGLRSGAVYHYRLVAVSSGGRTSGGDRVFRTKARITVAGVSGACVRASSARVRIGSLLSPRTTVVLDGKRVADRRTRAVNVRLRSLRAARHRIVVTVRSGAGTTRRTVSFRICAAARPSFTG